MGLSDSSGKMKENSGPGSDRWIRKEPEITIKQLKQKKSRQLWAWAERSDWFGGDNAFDILPALNIASPHTLHTAPVLCVHTNERRCVGTGFYPMRFYNIHMWIWQKANIIVYHTTTFHRLTTENRIDFTFALSIVYNFLSRSAVPFH